MTWLLKFFIAGTVVTLSSWLAGRKPGLAGFIIALPLTSMIALVLSYAEFRDPAKANAFARSILVAVPLSLTFFLPFLLGERLKWRFEFTYFAGILLLSISYLIHRWIFRD